MSAHDEMSKTTPQQFIIALVGGLVPVLLALFLVAQYVVGYSTTHASKEDTASINKAIAERIKPVGELAEGPAAGGAAKVERGGEEIFNAVCTACHTPGVAGAPKIGDKAAWGARISQGFDTLVKHATDGFTGKAGMMPAKGGAADLTDGEMKRAVAFMANKSGASFKAPEAKAPAAAPAASAPPAAAGGNGKGKTVFDASCAACHGAGVAGAPKAGDKAAWGPRIAQGKDTLYKHALAGFAGKSGMMPAKGGNIGLPDNDVKAAVDYMVGLAK